MNGNRKGSAFERQICKRLSSWWVPGRDDIFWRSCQSGGRATQRAKAGRSTFGSYGDIAAVDPIGAPLIKAFTIELKRGKSHGSLGELIDLAAGNGLQPFEKTIKQVMRSHEQAGSWSWMIISQRDRRETMIYAPLAHMREVAPQLKPCAVVSYCPRLGAYCLFRFLKTVSPQQIIKKAQSL